MTQRKKQENKMQSSNCSIDELFTKEEGEDVAEKNKEKIDANDESDTSVSDKNEIDTSRSTVQDVVLQKRRGRKTNQEKAELNKQKEVRKKPTLNSNKSAKNMFARTETMQNETNLHVKQHRHLFKLHTTLSNLYYMFSEPMTEENINKLSVFYKKNSNQTAITNPRHYFLQECKSYANYAGNGILAKEMDEELIEIWNTAMTENQKRMYKNLAVEEHKKKEKKKQNKI